MASKADKGILEIHPILGYWPQLRFCLEAIQVWLDTTYHTIECCCPPRRVSSWRCTDTIPCPLSGSLAPSSSSWSRTVTWECPEPGTWAMTQSFLLCETGVSWATCRERKSMQDKLVHKNDPVHKNVWKETCEQSSRGCLTCVLHPVVDRFRRCLH